MATTAALISVEEYLKTATDPDCEYVNGVLEERAVGELDHAAWQKAIEPGKPSYYIFQKGQLLPSAEFQLPGRDLSVPFSEIAALVYETTI